MKILIELLKKRLAKSPSTHLTLNTKPQTATMGILTGKLFEEDRPKNRDDNRMALHERFVCQLLALFIMQ